MNNQLIRRKTSFTLIELLVVLAIIAAIAAITFRLITSAQEKAMKGKAIRILEMVAFALEDYRAVYGIYPPVAAGTCCVSGHSNCQVCYFYEDSNKWTAAQIAYVANTNNPLNVQLYAFGMLGHLLLRERGCIYGGHMNETHHRWIGDNDRDVIEKNKWQHYLTGLIETFCQSNVVNLSTGETNANPTVDANYIGWLWETIRDPWLNVIHYETQPPYLAYKLWSDGPTSDPADDIHKDKWDN